MQAQFPGQEGSPATPAQARFHLGGERVPERRVVTRPEGCSAFDPRPPGFAATVHFSFQHPGDSLDDFREGHDSGHFRMGDR